jgi:hypothetical protein
VAVFNLYRYCSAVLVLSETVLVLVIESNLQYCYVRSVYDRPLNETKQVTLSEYEYEYEHEHEHENGPESQSYLPQFFIKRCIY